MVHGTDMTHMIEHDFEYQVQEVKNAFTARHPHTTLEYHDSR